MISMHDLLLCEEFQIGDTSAASARNAPAGTRSQRWWTTPPRGPGCHEYEEASQTPLYGARTRGSQRPSDVAAWIWGTDVLVSRRCTGQASRSFAAPCDVNCGRYRLGFFELWRM